MRVSDIDAWLTEEGCGYLFPPAAVVHSDTVPIVAPGHAKLRRARLLEWHDAEVAKGPTRGALARVVNREKLTRPTADHSNISKDIKKAREERAEDRRGGEAARVLGRGR